MIRAAPAGRRQDRDGSSPEGRVDIYPGVDQAFFNDERADAYNQGAAEDAWKRTLAHVRAHFM